MDCPKVSVIVPIYNAEEFLDEALDSLDAQQFDSFEVLLVNDGSTDSSGDIAKARAANSKRFRYFETENQGPGAARNFALTHARGKYIAFCDSDDMIPPFAYKHMFALAEKHNCDIVIGSAGRFNSEKRMPSRLHRKALANLDELVHITTHPQLIYDTTACKNMYSRAFLDHIGFQFPEGMVFEDMPAMIELQYRAETVAFLDEVVYMWRIRDKESQSITQDKAAVGALEDRIKAMRMTDAFFEKNVTEQELIRAKNRKWLANDLMIYVRALPELQDEQRRDEMRTIILDFAGSIEQDAFDDIDAIDRIKYHFLRLSDYKQLSKAIEYSSGQFRNPIATRNEDGQYYGSFGFEDLSPNLTLMTSEIANRGLLTNIERVTLGGDGFFVEGNLRIKGNLIQTDDQFELNLWLHPITIQGHTDVAMEILTSEVRPVIDSDNEDPTQYEWGFSTRLSSQQLGKLEDGTYKILVNASFNGLQLSPMMLKNPSQNRSSKPFAHLSEGRISTVLYNSLRELKLHIEKPSSPIIVNISDAGTHIDACDTEGNTHRIAYDEIDLENHRIGDPMDRPYYFLSLDPIACPYRNGFLRISRISSGQPYMTFIEKGVMLLDSYLSDTTLNLIMLPTKSFEEKHRLLFEFFGDTGSAATGLQFNSREHDGIHLLQIDARSMARSRFEENTWYKLQLIDNDGETCPLIRNPESCSLLTESITFKGREYTLSITNAGMRIKVKTLNAIRRRLGRIIDEKLH